MDRVVKDRPAIRHRVRRSALAVGAFCCALQLAGLAHAVERPAGSTRLQLAQATTPSSPSLTGALGQLMNAVGGASEPLPAPASEEGGSGRTSFTIPLAEAGDPSAIRVADDNGLISLAVRDAPLRHVLAMIADARGLNLVFAASTDVPVTATLDRVPIDEALDSLLSASGYTWTKSRSVLYVTSITEAEALPPNVQGRRVVVIELDFASAADVDQTVKGLLSPVGKSWITETDPSDNRRTTESIVIEDLAPYVARIEDYIAQTDQPPRQVLIEAHILEVDLGRDGRVGVDFDALARLSGASITLSSAGLANASASPGFFINTTGGDLSPLIECLVSTTDAKTLAAPKVLAVNGQQSRIQIGEQLGFRVTTTTETSTLESVEFLNVGVVLTVTPRITRDGRVLMRVLPKVSDGEVNPETGLPEEETAEIETDVLLSSGQGMVLGGLIQERDSTIVSKVPVLGSIPYAGILFQRRQVVKARSEIVVALVPHVLPYTPIQQEANDFDVDRSFTPLVYGPLCRYPRPWEPRLRDVMQEYPPCVCKFEEPCCPAPTAPASWTLRRLPPVECAPSQTPAPAYAPVLPPPTTEARTAEPAGSELQQPRLSDLPAPLIR